MDNFNKLIELFSENRNIHICITDISGVLENFKINSHNTIHSIKFCDIAKSTYKGYNLCIKCKNICNLLSIRRKKHFWGYCPFGLYELCYPVVYNNKTVCIIYIGNFMKDKNIALQRLEQSSARVGSDYQKLKTEFDNTETINLDEEKFLFVAKVLEKEIHERLNKSICNITDCQYAVEIAKNMAIQHYRQPLILKNIANSVYVNEKYLGRLFKKQTGKTFHEYLNTIRIINAKKLLKTTNKTVTEIAMETGFSSASYFNRNFLKHTNKTPIEYRKLPS